MIHHAHGSFDVKLQPLSPAPAEGVVRMSIDMQVHGDLEATTKGPPVLLGGPMLLCAAGSLPATKWPPPAQGVLFSEDA